MSMSTGGSNNELSNEINVTPMIDVLLVLLIIFMIVVPMSRKVIDIQLPDPTPAVVPPGSVNQQIVLEVLGKGQYAINKDPTSDKELGDKLKRIYEPRPDKIIFVKGANDALYQDVIFAMDMARGAGVKVIGVPPKDIAN